MNQTQRLLLRGLEVIYVLLALALGLIPKELWSFFQGLHRWFGLELGDWGSGFWFFSALSAAMVAMLARLTHWTLQVDRESQRELLWQLFGLHGLSKTVSVMAFLLAYAQSREVLFFLSAGVDSGVMVLLWWCWPRQGDPR